MESFDPKPMLTKYGGKTIAETPFASAQDPAELALQRLMVPDANGNQRPSSMFSRPDLEGMGIARSHGRNRLPRRGKPALRDRHPLNHPAATGARLPTV
jgi:hypothetical protein